nr:hypothetical protein [Tanacetum cinerariifolium]
MAPKAVLMKTSLRPLNIARPVNTAHPKTTVNSARPMLCFSKLAQSTVKRPFQQRITLTNKSFSQKVNTAKENFYIARPRAVNTARLRAVNTARPRPVNTASTKLMLLGKLTTAIDVNAVKGETHIQALIDKKKVIITEASVRSDLHLEDAEGTKGLPTTIIFEQLTLMGQVEGMLKHKEIYVTPSHTKKNFANIKRQEKTFLKQKSKKSKKRITKVPHLSESTYDVADEHVTITSNDLLSGEDRMKLTKLMELYTQLQSRVLSLETTKANQALEIGSLK